MTPKFYFLVYEIGLYNKEKKTQHKKLRDSVET